MPLTDEEKRRIEENRQKAKAVRDANLKQNQNTSQIQRNGERLEDFKFNAPSTSTASSSFGNRFTKVQTVKPKKQTTITPINKILPKAKCVLISRDKFQVDSTYFQPLIDICRRTDTAFYDAAKKRWNFHLKVYNQFVKNVEEIKDKISVEGLPCIITNMFSSVISSGYQKLTQQPPSYDLRNVDKTILSNLFPFQLEAVNYAISKGGRLLIADDMGLGKTVEALAIASYYHDQWPLLIISPANVRHAWIQAINKFYSCNYVSPDDVISPDSKKDFYFPSGSKFIFVISYDLMKSQVDSLLQRRFQIVILDESHFIKDYKSARSKSAVKLLKKAERVVLLSGTPALSRPIELFAQISAISPKIFNNYTEFAFRYCDAKRRPEQFGGGLDASGASNLEELEIVLKESVMIRRLKDDVMTQLQPKSRNVVLLDKSLIQLENEMLNKAKRTFFDENLKQMEKRGALLLFYNETAKAKSKAVIHYILNLLRENRKIVVFAHHQLMMDALEEAINVEDFQLVRIDGSTTSENRQKYVEKFQSNDEIKVALLSITAASTGLTLTAANLVVFAELFWNPGVLVQAEDRVHRVGQELDVEIRYLVAKGTADDDIWNLVKRKLSVLGKGGLSKDNFNDASTVFVKDQEETSSKTSMQTKLDDFWDHISMEDVTAASSRADLDDFWENVNIDDVNSNSEQVLPDLTEEPKCKKTRGESDISSTK